MTSDQLAQIEQRADAADIPALVAEIRRLRSEIADLKDDAEAEHKAAYVERMRND